MSGMVQSGEHLSVLVPMSALTTILVENTEAQKECVSCLWSGRQYVLKSFLGRRIQHHLSSFPWLEFLSWHRHQALDVVFNVVSIFHVNVQFFSGRMHLLLTLY